MFVKLFEVDLGQWLYVNLHCVECVCPVGEYMKVSLVSGRTLVVSGFKAEQLKTLPAGTPS